MKKRRNYVRDLNQVVAILRSQANELGMDWWEVAEESELCRATVENLFSGVTVSPRFKTVWAIAWTVGFELTMNRREGFEMKQVA